MSDYYYVQPTCPNCGALYKNNIDNLVCVNDDPEFPDSHYTCHACGKWIRVTCHMEFDYSVEDKESLPELPF
jgi:transposase-like protein